MKFTKEEALDELKRSLKAAVGDPALSDRTMREQLEALLPLIANEETELNDFVTKILPMVRTLDGGVRKNNSDFVKKWQKDHPEPATEQPESKAEPTAEHIELLKRIEALENEKRESDRKAAISLKRSQIAKAMESKGVKDREWASDILADITIAEDTDTEAIAEKYVKLYNKSNANTPAGVTPKAAEGIGEKADMFADVAALRKQRDEQRQRAEIQTQKPKL